MLITNNSKMPKLRETTPEIGSSPIYVELISQTPGRVRLRVAPEYRQSQDIEPLIKLLNERLEIYRVRANIHSGSITIFYAQDHINFEGVWAILQDLGVTFSPIPEQPRNSAKGQSDAAASVTYAVTHLNRRVRRATDGIIDIRFLIPLGLSVLAIRQLIVKGLMIEAIPWYVLAWYSFDSFIKLHYTSEPQE
ncbi:HMA2 domain-containing protein [Coleofasciculus sp.]|uniref:HMA2 domain-containing protein n=1 Tax=Coleofasciculus sp. TaxID=3100458 RepID=UPI0039F9F527